MEIMKNVKNIEIFHHFQKYRSQSLENIFSSFFLSRKGLEMYFRVF